MKYLKILILLSALLQIGLHVYGYMYANDTYDGFPEPEKGQISEKIVAGASNFLESNSEALLLLKEYEISTNENFNSTNAFIRTESALKKLEESKKNFSEALKIAGECEYESTYREKLINYNYDSYITEKCLNDEIANRVTYYLKRCDVVGLYRKNIETIDEIIELLKIIRDSLGNNEKPEISTFWTLMQKFSNAALFGNYSTVLSNKAFKSY
jgi:hypothetical protein